MNSKIAYLLALLALTSSLIQAQVFPVATTSISEPVPHANSGTNLYGVRSSMKINPVTGHPGIAHFDRTAGHLIYTESDGTDWTESVVDTFSTSSGRNPDHFYCSLAFDAAGKPNIAFFDRDEASLKFSRRNAADTGWITEFVDGVDYFGDAGRFCSLGHAPGGKFYVSYYHYEVDYLDQNNPDDITVYTADLRVATRSVSGTWSIETVDSVGDVGQSCALDIAPTGYPVVSYLDTTNQQAKVAFYNGTAWTKATIAPGTRLTAIDTAPRSNGAFEIYVVYYNPVNGAAGGALEKSFVTAFTQSNGVGGLGGFGGGFISGSSGATEASLVLDSNENPLITYRGPSGGLKLSHIYLYANERSSSIVPNGDLGAWGSLALHTDGMASICHTNAVSGKLQYAELTGWSVESIEATPNNGEATSLSYDPEGDPSISFIDKTNRSLKYAQRKGLGSWVVQTLDPEAGNFQTSLARGPEGKPSVCYVSSTQALVFTERKVDGGWLGQVVESGIDAYAASLAYGPEGRPSVSYINFYNDQIKYAEQDVSGIWQTQAIGGTDAVAGWTSLKFGPAGKAAICYHTYPGRELKLSERGSDGLWHVEKVAAFSRLNGCLTYDPQGNPAICYETDLENKYIFLLAERSSNGQWKDSIVDTSPAGQGEIGLDSSLSYSPSGRPAISYCFMGQGNLKFAERSASGIWRNQTVDSLGLTGYDTSLKYNPQGRPTISYQNRTQKALMFAERFLSPAFPEPASLFRVIAITRDPTTKAATLSWQGTTATKYDVEFSTSLAAGSWQPIGTDINALDGMTFFRTTPALGQANPRAFFRVKKQ